MFVNNVTEEQKNYYVGYKVANLLLLIVESLLGLRFLLKLTAANPGAGFVQFIYGISEAFIVPFRFMFPRTSAGDSVMEWSVLIAMVVYALVFNGIAYVIDIMRTADTGHV